VLQIFKLLKIEEVEFFSLLAHQPHRFMECDASTFLALLKPEVLVILYFKA